MCKRISVFTVFILVLTFLAAAIGGVSAESKILVNSFQGGAKLEWVQWVAERYMEENPGIVVEVMHAGYDELHTMNVAGVGPDLIHMGQSWGDYLYTLAPLNDYLAKSPELAKVQNDLIPGLRGLYNFEGSILAIPFTVNTWTMATNHDLLAAKGFAPPRSNWTWTEAMEIAKRTTTSKTGDGQTETWGIGVWWQPWNLLAYGGNIYSEDFRNSAFSSPARLAALRNWTDILASPTKAPDSFGSFERGTLAMMEMPVFYIGRYRDNADFAWDLVQYPKLEVEGKLYDGGYFTLEGFGLSNLSRNPDKAIRFLAYMYQKENITKFVREGAFVPPTMSGIPEFLAIPGDRPASMTLFLETLAAYQKPSNHPAYGPVFKYLHHGFFNTDRPRNGSMPPANIMEEANEAVQRGLDEFFVEYDARMKSK